MSCSDISHIRLGPRAETPEEAEKRFQYVTDQITSFIKNRENKLLRCKMRVTEVIHYKDADGSTNQERVTLQAVYGQDGTDNAKWAKYTPSANFVIHINNPDAFGKLSSGHEFFVDFSPAT